VADSWKSDGNIKDRRNEREKPEGKTVERMEGQRLRAVR